ncbi:hypothetical protein ACOME3_006481 [Neoechinorhynchus agilis]
MNREPVEESDFFEGDGLIERTSLPRVDHYLLASHESSFNLNDDAIDLFDVDFDSAYNLFKKQEDEKGFERFLDSVCDGSKVSKSSLLKRYKALCEELSRLEIELGEDEKIPREGLVNDDLRFGLFV